VSAESAAHSPEGDGARPLADVMQGLIKELARVDRQTLQRVRTESDLAHGDRPTYRVADVTVSLSGPGCGDRESFALRGDALKVTIDFAIRETYGGDLLG